MVFDSIEKLKNINDKNGWAFNELLNFAIGISKEEHLAHAFIISNNSMLVEKIHINAAINPYVEYIRIDDLSKESALKLLEEYGITGKRAELVWEVFGGKPFLLVQAIKHRDNVGEYVKKTRVVREDQVFQTLNNVKAREQGALRASAREP